MRNTRASSALAVVLTLAAAAAGQTFNDVPYAVAPLDAGGTATLHLDIYKPPGVPTPRPVVIWIHGGGWQSGSYDGIPGFLQPLLNAGVAIASVEYRLSGAAIFPAQIHDVKGAVRFLRANAATYGLDPLRFAAWGSSAGGHLAALLGTSGGLSAAEGVTGGNLAFSSRVQAVVDYFGPTDLLVMNLDVTTPPGSTINHDAPTSPESRLIGFDEPNEGIGVLRANQGNPNPPFPQKFALVMLANTNNKAGPDDPPFFIAHGTDDTSVPIAQSMRLRNALAAAGAEVTFVSVAGAGHGALGAATEEASRAFVLSRLAAVLPPNPGEMNCDGVVDFFDIDPFLLALFDGRLYNTNFPACDLLRADVNGDDVIDFFDVDPFLDVLFG